jgi:hypothetical protein
MKKMININLVVLIQILSISFCQADVIAENFDKTQQLTDTMLQQWLKYNPKLQYYDAKIQIESYYIQQALLNKRPQLGKKINAKIDFIHDSNVYQSAIVYMRKKIVKQVVIDEHELNNKFTVQRKKHQSRKHKA